MNCGLSVQMTVAPALTKSAFVGTDSIGKMTPLGNVVPRWENMPGCM
jgi:hypothetical protein